MGKDLIHINALLMIESSEAKESLAT